MKERCIDILCRRARAAGVAGAAVLVLLGLALASAAQSGRRAAAQTGPVATPPTTITVLTPDKTIYPKFCNTFVVTAPPGTTWRNFLAHVSDSSSIVSIWKYDNAKQAYYGVYFGDANAPTDGPATTDQYGTTIPLWICASKQGTFQ